MCVRCLRRSRALDSLGLELQMAVNYFVGAGNQAWVLGKIKLLQPQSHVSAMATVMWYSLSF